MMRADLRTEVEDGEAIGRLRPEGVLRARPARRASAFVLLGEPCSSPRSVLEHLLGDHPTVPPGMGIFLDRTRRMHPDVCRFV